MAVDIRNTKHFKKGEKLPDGTTAKRGVVWNTKTNKRVTGKVVMSTNAGVSGATKTYKAGRAVTAKKDSRPLAKGAGQMPGRPSGGTGDGAGGRGKEGPKPPKVGELRKGPRGAMNRWNGSRWVRASKGSTYQTGAGMTARPKTARPAVSGTVSSAIASAKTKKPASTTNKGNGSPAAGVRNAVIGFFQNRGGGSRPPASTGITAYQQSVARAEAAKAAANRNKKPEPPKVVKRDKNYIYYANGTKKAI